MSNPTVEITGGVEAERMNLMNAINDALSIALKTDPTSILFGQGERVILTFHYFLENKFANYITFLVPLVLFICLRRGFRWCLSMHERSPGQIWTR